MPENLQRVERVRPSAIGTFCNANVQSRDEVEWPAIEDIPHNLFPPHDRRYPLLTEPGQLDFRDAHGHALTGIELGVYDIRWLDWLSLWDIPTNAVFVSLINRSREAGPRQLLP